MNVVQRSYCRVGKIKNPLKRGKTGKKILLWHKFSSLKKLRRHIKLKLFKTFNSFTFKFNFLLVCFKDLFIKNAIARKSLGICFWKKHFIKFYWVLQILQRKHHITMRKSGLVFTELSHLCRSYKEHFLYAAKACDCIF